MRPLYSICISNYNMSSTLEESLNSILCQLTEKFEVIVVDDGSSDNSLEILYKMQEKYSILKVIPLLRDNRRKLGETRNVSVRAATGKYVLLHLDTDDVWDTYIVSFTKIYHDLEKRLNIENFMLSGKQIQMATKKLLLINPYSNIYYVEDRILWNNLAVKNRLISIDHKEIRSRIPIKGKKLKIIKAFKSQFSSMAAAYAYSPNAFRTTKNYLVRIKETFKNSFVFSIITMFLLLPSLLKGRFISRKPFENQLNGNPRKIFKINLNDLEKKYMNDYGELNLNNDERDIFINF